jgi:hypothetical protein
LAFVIVQQPRSLVVSAGPAALCVTLLASAGPPAQERARIEVGGSAGVTEVGRPLDVVRARAETLARARAVDAVVAAARQLASGQDQHHTEDHPAGDPEDGARAAASAKTASWQLRYWSNGAVTVRLSVPGDGILAGVGPDG